MLNRLESEEVHPKKFVDPGNVDFNSLRTTYVTTSDYMFVVHMSM